MGERLREAENAKRLVGLAHRAGREGVTDILNALRVKLREFPDSREARGALQVQVKRGNAAGEK